MSPAGAQAPPPGTSAPPVLLDKGEGIAVVTLNRPRARNAITLELLDALRAALAEADADPDVAAVVLTGADPAFCAGLDLRELSGTGPRIDVTGWDGPDHSPWEPLGKPLIGAVNGPAVTGGLEFALQCDVLVASRLARFADTHARVGVMPGWGLSVLLPRAVGRGMARRMSLTGEFVDAATALRCGLVTEVTEPEELLPRARDLALSVSVNRADAVRALLASYRGIEREEVAGGYRGEAATARAWAESGSLNLDTASGILSN